MLKKKQQCSLCMFMGSKEMQSFYLSHFNKNNTPLQSCDQ